MTPREALKRYFGYDSFRPGQEEIVSALLAGRDALAIMPTGAGKSLCYQVPALLLPGLTLVISPLISLMQDQVKGLNAAGIHAAFINSSLTETQIARALDLAAEGSYKLVYVAPERLESPVFRSFAAGADISMVTVDEAHCISQWGQDFRPSYLKILDFIDSLPRRPIVSAFTATATREVKDDIVCTLRLHDPKVLVTGFDRPNLYFQVERTRRKDDFVIQYLRDHPGESGIIYCATRKNVDKLQELLTEYGFTATKYHAGLSAEARRKNQNDFIYDTAPVIVATNAFGMGIDKSNVRFVLHYNMPQSMENYYQEAGRAGRDGLPSQCVLLFSAQDVIINEEDCGTLRGLTATAIKRNDDVVQTLYDRILGRTALNDVIHPLTGEVLCKAGEEITESIAEAIEKSPLESVEIRSVLTCESRRGVCAKCYGRNLATARMVQRGEVVGVIAAQSIGEPGTQLTLRTFHVGGVAAGTAVETNVVSKYEGRLEIDELRTVKGKNPQGEAVDIVISRQSEFRIVDPKTEIVLYTHNLPYGSMLYMSDGAEVKKGDMICEWDPYNAVIISEHEGKAVYDSVIEGVTYRDERDEQTGLSEKVIIESKDKTKNPVIKVINKEGEEVKSYNLPVSAHVVVKDNAKIKAGDILIKIPRAVGKSGGDITGGLPRVTELFEARNPSNPAIVSEIDGEVTFGKIKRGNREIIITSKEGDVRRYLVPLSRQIIVQENDYVKAGGALSDGAITPSDILNILGLTKVQEYIVNEVQEVYRMQGVKINDKHFEVIVRQMMSKVKIEDPGDTRFFEDQIVDKWEFMDVNDELYDKVVVTDAGDSTAVQPGQIISMRKLRDENSSLKRRDLNLVKVRDIVPATSTQILQGITRAALQTSSFISAASFQETTKVLNEAAIQGKVDPLENLKENVICGHLIPGGTGMREYDNLVVGLKEDLEAIQAAK